MDEKRIATMNKYNNENTTQIALRFMNKSDADVIEKLKSVGSKVQYVRQLIRDDIAKEKGEG